MEPITTRVAKIYLDEHGFIRVDVNPGAEESYADAKHNMSMMAQAGQGTRRPVIVNMKQMKAIAREARAHYASEEAAKIQKSVALVVSTPVSKVIGIFSSPSTPQRSR